MAMYQQPPPATLKETQTRLGVTDQQLDREIDELQFSDIARLIGTTTTFEIAFGLDANERQQINTTKILKGHLDGTIEMFQLWRRKFGEAATYRRLLEIVFKIEKNAEMGEKILRLCKATVFREQPTTTYHQRPYPAARSGSSTPEYRTMVKSTATLVREFVGSIGELGDEFFAMGLIGPGTRDDVKWTGKKPQDRSRDLVSALTSKVQTSTDNYWKIVEIVKGNDGDWTQNIIVELLKNYKATSADKANSSAVLHGVPEPCEHTNKSAAETVVEKKQMKTSVPHYLCNIPEVQSGKSAPSVPEGAAGAQVDRSKLWSGRLILFVHIFNHHNLGQFGLNKKNVIQLANVWHYMSNQKIPKFEHVDDKKIADIRVRFGNEKECKSWSYIGIGAELILDKDVETLSLGFVPGNTAYNDHIVIHEFGHALGMVHEHQRSKFWLYAERFLDIEKMETELGPSVENYKEFPTNMREDPNSGSVKYDPDSIMHYWFSTLWLRDSKYHTVGGIRDDRYLSEEERDVLLGIHKRAKCAEEPSQADVEFLADCYQEKAGMCQNILSRGCLRNWIPNPFRHGPVPPGQLNKSEAPNEDNGVSYPDQPQVHPLATNVLSAKQENNGALTIASLSPLTTPPTFEQLKQQAGVSNFHLDEVVSQQRFPEIASHISDIGVLETGLGLDENEIQQIRSLMSTEENNLSTIISMLELWARKAGSGATYGQLVKILYGDGENAKMGFEILKICKDDFFGVEIEAKEVTTRP